MAPRCDLQRLPGLAGLSRGLAADYSGQDKYSTGVDPLDAAESAAAVRSATNLRSISRTSGSVVRSTASEHSLARRQYSAACELMEPLVSMSTARDVWRGIV